MSCTHTKWENRSTEYEHPWTGEIITENDQVEVSTCEDVDLHRYACTKCGEMFYYSGAARRFYEDGIKSPYINGLG